MPDLVSGTLCSLSIGGKKLPVVEIHRAALDADEHFALKGRWIVWRCAKASRFGDGIFLKRLSARVLFC
jgi:hypothetical protein